MREMEIFALGMQNESNGRQLDSLLESYRRLMFPGNEKVENDLDNRMEQAKRLLAEEAKKVLLVRPLMPGERLEGTRLNANMKKLAARHAADLDRENRDEARRRRQRGRKPQGR